MYLLKQNKNNNHMSPQEGAVMYDSDPVVHFSETDGLRSTALFWSHGEDLKIKIFL